MGAFLCERKHVDLIALNELIERVGDDRTRFGRRRATRGGLRGGLLGLRRRFFFRFCGFFLGRFFFGSYTRVYTSALSFCCLCVSIPLPFSLSSLSSQSFRRSPSRLLTFTLFLRGCLLFFLCRSFLGLLLRRSVHVLFVFCLQYILQIHSSL